MVQNYPYVGLANRWFQPLTHLSSSTRRRFRSGLQIYEEKRLFQFFLHSLFILLRLGTVHALSVPTPSFLNPGFPSFPFPDPLSTTFPHPTKLFFIPMEGFLKTHFTAGCPPGCYNGDSRAVTSPIGQSLHRCLPPNSLGWRLR